MKLVPTAYCIYRYIYIYRERERETQVSSRHQLSPPAQSSCSRQEIIEVFGLI